MWGPEIMIMEGEDFSVRSFMEGTECFRRCQMVEGRSPVGCGNPGMVAPMGSQRKGHTTSRLQFLQIHPWPNAVPSHTSLQSSLSLPSDGCQMLYPSWAEMYLGIWSLDRVHVAAFIGFEWSPTDFCLPPIPLSPRPFPAGCPFINHQADRAKFCFPLFKSEGIYSCW